jgi:predicted permease
MHRLLARLLPADSVEEVLGDLEESFQRRAEREGEAAARRWYRGQGVRLLGRLPESWLVQSGGTSAGAVRQDLRYGLRTLARSPLFTGLAILILAIGIGANTAIFSVLKAAFLEPLPYTQPSELVVIWNRGEDGGRGPASFPDYEDWRSRNNTFEDMGAFGGRYFNLSGGDEPERLYGAIATASLFRLLEVTPDLGRSISSEDEDAGSAVVLLSHELWARRFGGDRDIVGRTIRVDGSPLSVIGVMPAGFQIPSPWWHYNPRQELWTPFPLESQREGRDSHSYPTLGRTNDGVSLEVAQQDLRSVSSHLAEEYPESNAGNWAWVVPLRTAMYGEVGFQVMLVFGAAGLVLLIACGNVAGLQLARAGGRRTEMAVRAAMGAGRGRVVRQLLTESTLLALAGGMAGVLLAVAALGAFRSLIPPSVPRVERIGVDGAILGFALIVSLLTGIVFGLAPALSASKANLTDSLREGGGRGGHASPARERLRSAFVTVQFALCLVLLNGGLLLLKSYSLLQSTDAGFQAENVLTMALSLGGDRFRTAPERAAFIDEVEASLRTLPGVRAVGAVTKLPLLGGTNRTGRAEHEAPRERPNDGWLIEVSGILGDYHDAMGIPLLAGRMITPADTVPGDEKVVINQAMARRMWPDEEPLGKRFTFEEDPPRWLTVVGVVGDVRQWGLESRPIAEVYLPYTQRSAERVYLTVRTETDPSGLVAAARARVLAIDPDQPVSEVRTTDEIVRSALEPREFFTFLTGAFAAIALILAAVGIYGVTAYHVQQRTHEIGVRIAMGAARTRVLGLVLRRGTRMVAFGLVLGLSGALASGAIVSAFLWEVGALDPATLALTALVLSAIALLGSLVPAVRASRVPPMHALRAE